MAGARYTASRARAAAAARVATPRALALVALAAGGSASAQVLPEDRADAMYHHYDGGGVTIEGPAMLVRKQVADNVSVSAHYYIDQVSSASIDVVTTASPYSEERREYDLGVDYLHDGWIMSASFGDSEESDYSAKTVSFDIAQSLFGDLTTVSLGYTRGRDEVRRRGDLEFAEDVKRNQYRLGLTQIFTRNFILSLAYESISDQGYLANPYRSVRYLDDDSLLGYSFERELYPSTRTSDAAALRMRYHLPYRAAVQGEYRAYADSWGARADTYELGYTHPLEGGWTVEGRLRLYSQQGADFYSDLFPYSESQNFRARDKELASFTSYTLRAGVSYDILRDGWRFVDRGSVSLVYDHIRFDYDDFRDLRSSSAPPGQESLYAFGANVFHLFASFWF